MARRETWQIVFSEEGYIRRLWAWHWHTISRFNQENRGVALGFRLATPEARVENPEQFGNSPTDTRFFPEFTLSGFRQRLAHLYAPAW